ncbi:BamA/TamA family outer membrane protein [Carboxylicivirga sediminis]|uniref:BamA/TamA family outer membrane protein n=1 Tax=Carboxylicivirga sediminis TaxID=2006564 RepID=A0A941IY71_9BACT|nr:BamA/TamA family outer membrane protein [Carboxylicivirga sediminis]MBR8537586.1 BamA/TamA family outer membrane protein [Carboxylicivirga sediminis]
MLKNFTLSLFLFSLTTTFGLAQTDSSYIKEGFTFGLLPAVSFDADLGFQYGGLTNLYWYGDGSAYPDYNHSLYLEFSKYTAGSTLARLYYDSPSLIRNIRTTADVTWFRDLAMDFYGFNGREAVYNNSWEDDHSIDYKSRVFYRHHRSMFRIMTNFKGSIQADKPAWSWMAGLVFFDFTIGSVDIDRLNKNKDDDELLPPIDGLYDKYVDWGIINTEEAEGGRHAYLKAGLSYDTRDIIANPTKGTWTELFIAHMPAFLSNHSGSYTRINLFHRQYFNLTPKRNLIAAYRIGFQHKLNGTIPFYLLPHMASSVLTSATSQGLGGAKTLRGINRNRLVGNGSLLTNIELRWKMWRTKLFRQDFYLGTNYFVDMGLITQAYKYDKSMVPQNEYDFYFNDEQDRPHFSYGLGLKAALNENFVLSADYGIATNKQDGTSGLYITLNYLF